jgi:ParB family chromosome partitioning protein
MITQVPCCPLSIKKIDRFNSTYRLRPEPDHEITPSLEESIKKVGILHPPLLLKKNSQFIILSGRKRIQVVSKHGIENIPCFILDDETSPSMKWQLLLSHAIIGNTLSIIEQANFFCKAESQLTEQQALSLLPLLGIKPHIYKLQEFAMYLKLDQTAIDALHTGHIQAKTGSKLSKLSSEDQQTVVYLINHFKLGGSKQKKLITFVIDLIMRTKRPLKTILSEWEEQQDIGQDNRPQQAMAFLHWLERQCFPKINAAEQEFQRFHHDLQLPENTILQHTPSFEDNGLTLSITFTSQSEFLNHWENIKKNI